MSLRFIVVSFVLFIGALVLSQQVLSTPVFADGNCVATTILGDGQEVCDDGSGSSIWSILKSVLDIMSIGVGILGVVGISIVGIQYLTAGSNEEKTRKAKKRMYEIALGLAAYAIIMSIMSWLMPNYDIQTAPTMSSSSSSKGGGSTKGKLVKSGNKAYYYDENNKKVKGAVKINGAEYYFDKKTGAMKTGWVTINKKIYYYKKNGKKSFGNSKGVLKAYGPTNQIGKKDTWYLNRRTGAVKGAILAVPQILQGECGCGPTSILEIRAYHIGKKHFYYDGNPGDIDPWCPSGGSSGSYAWNDSYMYLVKCGGGSSSWGCADEFGYKTIDSSSSGEDAIKLAKSELMRGRPIILSATGNEAHKEPRFAGGGHYLVIKGFHNNTFYYSDPANRIKESSASRLQTVISEDRPSSGLILVRKR